jgi:dTDP-4-amino-4,6-dideoxygalactose transaminase
MQECFAYLGYCEGDFPVSEAASHCVLALPMYPELTAAQQDHVIGACAEFALRQERMAA